MPRPASPTPTSRRAHPRPSRSLGAWVGVTALVATLVPAFALAGGTAASSAPGAPSGPSGPGDALWSPVRSATDLAARAERLDTERTVTPSRSRSYVLDAGRLGTLLDAAPAAGGPGARAAQAAVRITVPAPNGDLVPFDVVESPVMQAGLAAAHPDFMSYEGRAADGFLSDIRIDVSPFGFHASVRGDHAAWFVDPALVGDDGLYLSYFGKALPEPEQPLVEPELDEATTAAIAGAAEPRIGEGPDGQVRRRTYRLALLTDPSYAQYFAAGVNDGTPQGEAASDAAVLAAKQTLINRVNQIYGDDLGITMLLIDATDTLNLDTVAEASAPGGPCGQVACFPAELIDPVAFPDTAGCSPDLLDRNRLVVGQLVGAEAFDVGHIGLGINGGGIAGLGVVGGDEKAVGCTGLPFPVGDFYAVDYVAHELGHQFAGNHTFNGTQRNCSGANRNPGTSVEPGSGSSVMAYAGICGSDDLQPHTDPYFSQASQTEIGGYVNSALDPVTEVQSVALTGYDPGESFTLTVPGVGTTTPIVQGASYDAAGIERAVEALYPTAAGAAVRVTPYFGAATFDATGFQITFAGTPRDPGGLVGTDVPSLEVTPVDGELVAQDNAIAQGGPPTNQGAVALSENRNPTVTAPADRTIPVRTPFALTGSATDSDGDPLLYLWEQNDRGALSGQGLVSPVRTNGPLFRVFGTYADVSLEESLLYESPGQNSADASPTRVFPDLAQVLAGATNAETGLCPTSSPTVALPPGPELDCVSEILPTAAYIGDGAAGNSEPSLNFRLTARDSRGTSGGSASDDVRLRVDPTAGPFLVISQDEPSTWAAGSQQIVTWDVNGTAKPALAPSVRITLSTDGGATFDRVLAASVPNNGAALITVPDAATTRGRIRIEAIGNYFFDVNDAPITVTPGPATPVTPAPGTAPGAPDTAITAGPADGSLVLDRRVSLALASTAAPAAFRCTLDGAPVACGSATRLRLGRAPGTRVLTVAAVDSDGDVDASPARRRFIVPVDDARLRARGGWRVRDRSAAYRGADRVARSAGATLTTRVADATSISLVVGTGRSSGAVEVYLGRRLLDRVSLQGPRRARVVVPVADFAASRRGRLRIVSTGSRPVRIDGVGVAG